jgi:hypothetical protein
MAIVSIGRRGSRFIHTETTDRPDTNMSSAVDSKKAVFQYPLHVLSTTKKGTKISGIDPSIAPAVEKRELIDPIQFTRRPGLGDRIFALAAVGAYKKTHRKKLWFSATDKDEWLDWVPFIEHGINNFANTVVNFDNVPANAGDRATFMASLLGCELFDLQMPIKIPNQFRDRIERPYFVFVPFSSRRGPRSLPHNVVNDVCNKSSDRLVLIDDLPHESPGLNLVNQTASLSTEELIGIVADAEAVISVDTGPLYVAAMLGKPAIGFFSHVPPEHRVLCTNTIIAIDSPAVCSPCYDHIGTIPPCKFVENVPKCISYYTTETIFYLMEELKGLLK